MEEMLTPLEPFESAMARCIERRGRGSILLMQGQQVFCRQLIPIGKDVLAGVKRLGDPATGRLPLVVLESSMDYDAA